MTKVKNIISNFDGKNIGKTQWLLIKSMTEEDLSEEDYKMIGNHIETNIQPKRALVMYNMLNVLCFAYETEYVIEDYLSKAYVEKMLEEEKNIYKDVDFINENLTTKEGVEKYFDIKTDGHDIQTVSKYKCRCKFQYNPDLFAYREENGKVYYLCDSNFCEANVFMYGGDDDFEHNYRNADETLVKEVGNFVLVANGRSYDIYPKSLEMDYWEIFSQDWDKEWENM